MPNDIPPSLTTSVDALSFAGAMQAAATSVLLGAGTNTHTGRAYKRALADFLRWYAAQGEPPPPLSRPMARAYREALIEQGIAASSINQRLAAIRGLASELALLGVLPEPIAVGITQVKNVKQQGKRLGNWLTKEQAQALLDSPNTKTLRGLRDRAILAVFLGAGLRRDEVSNLTVAHLQQRDGHWALVDIFGKHHRIRTVPIGVWVYAAIHAWLERARITECAMFRAINRGDRMTSDAPMTDQAVRNIVKGYLSVLGFQGVAPHDLRRTFAKLAQTGGAPIQQIQMSLGHASVKTTEIYLGTDQDFTNAPSDVIGLSIGK